MSKVTMICKSCSYEARRELINTAGCRGIHEAYSERGLCPNGHGELVRKDGGHIGGLLHPPLK